MKFVKRFFYFSLCGYYNSLLFSMKKPMTASLRQTFFIPVIILLMIFVFSGLCLAEINTSTTSDIIYVADFLLDAESDKKEDKKHLPIRNKLKDIVNNTEISGKDSPQIKKTKIVNALAESIVKELKNKGLKAHRIFSQFPPFRDCFLLEGEFQDYEEGERVKRAIIGFGSGSSEMQVKMIFSKISEGKTNLILDTSIDGKKQRSPGAVVTKNPYVAGTKFILSRDANEKEVGKLGSDIANKLYKFIVDSGLILQKE